MFNWICALELDQDRQIIAGSEKRCPMLLGGG